MADLSNPLAEAIVKVKLDPASFNQMRSQLEGMGKGAQNQVAQGIGGTAATAAAAGVGVKLAEAFSSNFKDSIDKSNLFSSKSIKAGKEFVKEFLEIQKAAGKKPLLTDFSEYQRARRGWPTFGQFKNADQLAAAKEQFDIASKTTRQYREMARAAYQLRGGVLEVAGILRNIALPTIGLMVMGIRKFMQTSAEGSLELRKSFGGLVYSWNQFLARVGDVANKSLGLNKIFKTMKDILDNIGPATIGTILNVTLWAGVLSIVLGIKAGILGLYGSIMRATSGLVKFIATFKLAQAASGKAGWAGFMAGMGGVTGGKIGAVSIGGAVAASLALMLAMFLGAFEKFMQKWNGITNKAEGETTRWSTILAVLDGLLSRIGTFLKNLTVLFVGVGSTAFGLILDELIGFWKILSGVFTANFKKIKDGFTQMFTDRSFITGIKQYFKDWWTMVKEVVTGSKGEGIGKKYSSLGTTSTVGFGDLNRIAQDMADNSMIMASENMIKAADKMNEAADKMNSGNGLPPGLAPNPFFSVSFGT